MIKIIAIGNRLMGDDGIALKVLENIDKDIKKLKEDEKVNQEIEVIIGETDFMYSLDKIDDYDFVIILDSTALGVEPGRVTVLSLKEYKKYLNYESQHGINLVDMLTVIEKMWTELLLELKHTALTLIFIFQIH